MYVFVSPPHAPALQDATFLGAVGPKDMKFNGFAKRKLVVRNRRASAKRPTQLARGVGGWGRGCCCVVSRVFSCAALLGVSFLSLKTKAKQGHGYTSATSICRLPLKVARGLT